ncbi:hypothetical protein ENUP19_0130G0034 [Entamoeba nuttalli]|uniref:Uncharacterized protein n=1 Tax=Entamoeba nuttalli TaxID=412467 RepID=A0ABQ0DJT9_9EUKA
MIPFIPNEINFQNLYTMVLEQWFGDMNTVIATENENMEMLLGMLFSLFAGIPSFFFLWGGITIHVKLGMIIGLCTYLFYFSITHVIQL